MKKIKFNMQKKLFAGKFANFVVLPTLLLLFWFVSSTLFNTQTSFSVLKYGHSNNLTGVVTKKLLKGEKIYGEFTAKENYLGFIIIRFERYVKPDFLGEDVLSFRLKEKGAKDWYYFNNYRSGLVENFLLFPFGFPRITFSKNKTYQFEIESLLGNDRNAVEVSSEMPVLISGYQFPHEEIFGSKSRTINFIFKKIFTSFTSIDFLLNSTIFILPLVFYLFFQSIAKNFKIVNQILPFATIIFIFIDIFFLKEIYLGISVGLIIAWIFAIKLHKLESSVSFFMSFILLIIWMILLAFSLDSYYNKINIWTYTFLVFGVFQSLQEERKISKKLKGYKDFLHNPFILYE